jgi:protein-disulfide isomerase
VAKKTPPAQRSSLLPFYVILGIVAVAGIGVLAYQMLGRAQPATRPVTVALDAADLARTRGIAMGPEDAPVVLYEFADFQCPGCAQFAMFMKPLIEERLVGEGLVRYVYYDFPLVGIHPNAFLAARAGRCAEEQGQFWAYHDVLYGRQPTWSAMRDPAEFFVQISGEIGLDRRAFESCLRSDRHAEEVTRNMQLGESLNVRGTPTLILNGRMLPGVPNFRDLEQMVREEAGQAPAPAAEGATPAAAETAPQ